MSPLRSAVSPYTYSVLKQIFVFPRSVSFQHLFGRFPSLIGKAEQLVWGHRQKTVRPQTLYGVAHAGLRHIQFFGNIR